ncbi:MAG: hypothetical protein QM820_10360 [Minicystis sp.]
MSRRLRFDPHGVSVAALSLAALAGLTACGSGDGDGGSGGGPGDVLSVEGRLPDGDWSGTLTDTCSSSGQRDVQFTVNIADNVILRDFSDGEFFGAALDTFQYTAPSAADWLGLMGQRIGACSAHGGELRCETLPDQAVQEQRTLTFFVDALRWSAKVSSAEEVCTTEGALARR